MYQSNTVIRMREGNRHLEVIEEYDALKTLVLGTETVPAASFIEVTEVREDTQWKSPTPIDHIAPKKVVEIKHLINVANIVVMQPAEFEKSRMFNSY